MGTKNKLVEQRKGKEHYISEKADDRILGIAGNKDTQNQWVPTEMMNGHPVENKGKDIQGTEVEAIKNREGKETFGKRRHIMCTSWFALLERMKITWRTRERATEETEGLKLSGSDSQSRS